MKSGTIQYLIYWAFFMLVSCGWPAIIMAQVSTLAAERVLVHTDKPYYLTGETLWFSAYCHRMDNGNPSDLSQVLYLEIFNDDDQPVAQLVSSLNAGHAKGQVFLNTNLSTGAYLLRAYTSLMRNGKTDDFYQQNIWIINPLSTLEESQIVQNSGDSLRDILVRSFEGMDNGAVEISTDRETYGVRQQVSLTLNAKLNISEQVQNLSVSVYPFHKHLEMASMDWLVAGTTGNTGNRMNNLGYLPEAAGPIVYGEYTNGVFEGNLMVSIPGNNSRIYQAIDLHSNNFILQLSKELDYQKLYFWAINQEKPVVTLRSPFDLRPSTGSSIAPVFDTSTVEFIERQSVNMQLSNLYREYNSIQGNPRMEASVCSPFYGTPEFVYHLDDFTRFPGLEEVFREYVRYVSLRRKNGILNMYVWDHYGNQQSIANNVFFDQPALILLDGIPVQNTEWLLALDPLKIRSIEIATKEYLVGDKTFKGVVNLVSFTQEFVKADLPLDLEVVTFPGLQQPLSFHHPEHTTNSLNSRIPDRRNTLYWNPDVSSTSTTETLKFYTGDSSGDYLISVRGVTSRGRLIYSTKLINVVTKQAP